MDGSAPPPPYTVQPQQFPTSAAPQAQNGFTQIVSEKQNVYMQPPQTQQNHIQSPQLYPAQQPLQQPPAHQPVQYPPNMTPQQQQQVQQIIQTLPPEKIQLYQQQAQQFMNPQPFQQPQQIALPIQQHPQTHYTTTAPSGLLGPKHSSHSDPTTPKDAQKTDSVKRFFGDTLFGRVARSSVQTVTSTMKMPTSLSPWGDNNPVTLPNVRYRDAVLFTTFAFVGAPLVEGISDGVTSVFGADSFISEVVSSGAGAIVGSTVLKYGVFQLVEQAIDKGVVEHLLPEEEKMLRTTGVTSLQVGIKHKLMGVDADLRFIGVYPSRDTQACEKGWFCPYLFASARTPSVPRANDFAICQFFGPFLGGDYHLTQTLLAQTTHILPLCDPNPQTDIGTNRLLVLFTAISPYRSVWSTSRRPGCGMLSFHLFDGCPGLVVPVTSSAPICAWSPWTLDQMLTGGGGYSAEWQHEQICEWLDGIVSVGHFTDGIRGRWVDVLGRGVSLVVNGALGLRNCGPSVLEKVDKGRAGIVMFRY